MSMKPVQLLQICLITTRSSTLFLDSRLNNIITALYSRRSFTVVRGRNRHPRANNTTSPATPFQTRRSAQNNLTAQILQSRSLRKVVKSFVWANMAVEQRRNRGFQESASLSLDTVLASNSNNMVTSTNSTTNPATSSVPTSPRAAHSESVGASGRPDGAFSSSMASPPPQTETSQTRPTRSTSTTSRRNSHRLSLTLPIAPPNSFPSRPTPTTSVPPTPIETSVLSSPTDPNDFVIAIAAQERHVLELREELSRAETELKKLKKQYSFSEAHKKRAANRNVEPMRAMAPAAEGQLIDHDDSNAKYSSELERRKAILLAQSQRAPREHKRTVIRGGHTRTLSLLSPTKSANSDEERRSMDLYPKASPISTPLINKRATWAPRQSQPTHGMKQIANDFKQGLWTFVEDLRQATVGDEGISGTTNRTSDMGSRDQDTIRASSTTQRGRIPFSESPPSTNETSTPGKQAAGSFSDRYHQHRRSVSRAEAAAKTKKHFSWTPLTFDSYDDEDWSNWDTPNVKTARWSGSTVNGGDIVSGDNRGAAVGDSEGTQQHAVGTPPTGPGILRRKQSRSELRDPSPQTPRFEELPQAILSRLAPLTPTNLKNGAGNFIKEWEKSLSSPTAESTDSLI
ncbi:hypothetical protein F5Y04DRAFT_61567 [Hypomontagnella monticulosa]|nr:hypothetical protein F5Y04DRAFT_61567 [Hypomontagnella monticulosa]